MKRNDQGEKIRLNDMSISLAQTIQLFLPGRLISKSISMICVVILFVYSSANFAHDASSNMRHDHKDIRVVMAAAFVSESGIGIYDEIFKYLAAKLNRKITFISGFSYSTINQMLDKGMVDVGFICGLPYVLKHDITHPAVQLIAAPVMADAKYDNKPQYFSYLITHKDNKAKKFTDTRGQRFVYNDEISNSGYNMPRAYMISLGETKGFFSKVIRSGSHEESIRLVATKEADVSAVDSLVYEYELKQNPEYVRNTKIIKVLGPAGIPPIVVSTKVSAEVKKEIQKALLNMQNDTAGKLILKKALIRRFMAVSDKNYDDIRKMKRAAENAGYLTIK